MARDYRPNLRETSVISRLDSAKEAARMAARNRLYEAGDELASRVAMKLIEEHLVETKSKAELERQLAAAVQKLLTMEEFDIQFKITPYRAVAPRPHFVSLFLTAFVLEDLINHKSIVDIYGTDDEIYACIHSQVGRFISG